MTAKISNYRIQDLCNALHIEKLLKSDAPSRPRNKLLRNYTEIFQIAHYCDSLYCLQSKEAIHCQDRMSLHIGCFMLFKVYKSLKS